MHRKYPSILSFLVWKELEPKSLTCNFPHDIFYTYVVSLVRQYMREMNGNNFGYLFPQFSWLPAGLQYSHAYSSIQPAEPEVEESSCSQYFLEKKIKDLESKLKQLQEENASLKRQLKPKRKYSKRRAFLRKQHRCHFQQCKREYSSNIALKSHLRKKHNLEA